MDIIAFIQPDRFDRSNYDSEDEDHLVDNRGARATWALEAALGVPAEHRYNDIWRADMNHVRRIDIRASKGAWHRLQKRIRFTAPILESIKLTLAQDGRSTPLVLEQDEEFDHDALVEGPIRRLHVDGIVLPHWTSLAFNLVHLKINNTSRRLPGHLLYEVLERCPLLETLELGVDCLRDKQLNFEHESSHPFSMQYLHTLILGLTYGNCVALLDCIILPPSCSITIGSLLSYPRLDGLDAIGLFVRSLCADRSHTFARNFIDDSEHVELSISTDDKASITTIVFPLPYGMNEEQWTLTRCIMEAAANAHLHTIDIESRCSPGSVFRHDSLARVLDRSPNLHEIRIGRNTSIVELFFDVMLRQDRTPVLPLLRRVAFCCMDFPTELGDLETFLQRRIESGHKLPALSIRDCELSESDIPRLRELVGELEWEAKEPMFPPGFFDEMDSDDDDI